MKKNIYAAIILASALIGDIASKAFIVKNFSYFDRVDFLGGFLRITLVYNEGGVFGIFQGYKNMFLIISFIVLFLMLAYYVYEKNKNTLFCAAMALIASGAVGNIIDRLLAGRPGVVDFISIGVDGVYRWPTFNIADTCIVVGAVMLVIVFYREEKKQKEKKNA
ncbi:MAG: signal peptidase II [Spirochaetia bacterium]|nr:signal peptidase II [Spirochaetia bacterium]